MEESRNSSNRPNRSSRSIKKLLLIVVPVLLIAGVLSYLFLIPRYEVSIKNAAIKSKSNIAGVKQIEATLDLQCNATVKEEKLVCQQSDITGAIGGNRDLSLSLKDSAAKLSTSNNGISLTPESVSFQPVVIRPEPVSGVPPKTYEIIAQTNSDKKIVILYKLTVNTTLSESDLKSINKEPTAEIIKGAVKQISTVKDVCITTEDNDPNGKLGKPGTYYIKVTFADNRSPADNEVFDESTQSLRPAKDTCEVGVEAGGSIEIFKNKDDAEKRKAELDALAGGFFDSGTSKVVNTAVIRTSGELKASQQQELEKQLIDALTK